MQISRAFRLALVMIIAGAIAITALFPVLYTTHAGIDKSKKSTKKIQQLVELVDFQGNRRLRDDDLIYYVQTRAGNTFSQEQIQRDLQTLLSLNFFEKTKTRVLVEDGSRGGVNVIFVVEELPIIRDLQFKGLKAVQESDVLKEFREKRIGISKEAVFDPVKVRGASRLIRELLSSKGYPNATVDVQTEAVSATSTAITFTIEQGERSRIAAIDFDGNQTFKDGELRSQLKLTKKTGLISRFSSSDILDRGKLDYDLNKNVLSYIRSKGYLQARLGEPQVESLGNKRTGFFLPLPVISSKDDTLKVTVPVTEGRLYKVGTIKIEGNSIFSEDQIRSVIGLQPGEIADGKRLQEGLFENLKKLYGSQGFIQYDAELNPELKDSPTNQAEGIADFNIVISEGKQFTLRRLEFRGNNFTRDFVLRREFLLNEGDVYNDNAFDISVLKLNQSGYFDPIDKDKDKIVRTDESNGLVDIDVNVKERGKQQISFNGGISGIGGSSFGLDYSTSNLFGRGVVLGLSGAVGNRQQSFSFSLTQPYFRNRPISVGVSLFGYSRKYFGEGTFLSQNQDAQISAQFSNGLLTTDADNLFTQISYGATLSVSAPLDEFYRKRRFTRLSRVGLNYQISATEVRDPPINAAANGNAIPVLFSQPNIITSQITPSFIYSSLQYSGNGLDPSGGRNLLFSVSLAGLGGDVRTYQPQVEYKQFIPIRRKKSSNPEVFGFRILAGTIGSYAATSTIRNANSLSFINGVPVYTRYFLGDETTIRGYNTRSIGPLAPVETYISTRNVTVATNQAGAATATDAPAANTAAALSLSRVLQSANLTGAGGSNPSPLISRTIQSIGGDTQILGNFEYRVPIFGPASLAAFADIGTAFNLRKGSTQAINSNFLADQPFLSTYGVTTSSLFLSTAGGSVFQPTASSGLIARDNGSLLTRSEYSNFIRNGAIGANGFPVDGSSVFQEVFLRGEAQTNTLVGVSNSAFSKISDYRASLGVELRVQVPIVNVPFRLIYAYNPNARGIDTNLGLNFGEKKNVVRFTVGRTF